MSSEFGAEENVSTQPVPTGRDILAYITKIVHIDNHEPGKPKSYEFVCRNHDGIELTYFFETDEQERVGLKSVCVSGASRPVQAGV